MHKNEATTGFIYYQKMGRARTASINDQFADVFGTLRGSKHERARSQMEMPQCPISGHQELAAVNMRPQEGSLWWEVGWYGSEITFSFVLDDTHSRALWTRHYSSRSQDSRVLSHEDPYPHLRLSWADLPETVQERIHREVSLGINPRASSSNDRPLNPF
jgi:hypothetical protein